MTWKKTQFLLLLDHFGLIRANSEKKPAKIIFIPKIITWFIWPFQEFKENILTQKLPLGNQSEKQNHKYITRLTSLNCLVFLRHTVKVVYTFCYLFNLKKIIETVPLLCHS